jgi:hypothetical protein
VDEHMHVITAWTEFGGLGSSWVDPATHRRSYCGAVSVTSRLTWFAVPVALFLRCSLSRRQLPAAERTVRSVVPAFCLTPRGVPVSRLPPVRARSLTLRVRAFICFINAPGLPGSYLTGSYIGLKPLQPFRYLIVKYTSEMLSPSEDFV